MTIQPYTFQNAQKTHKVNLSEILMRKGLKESLRARRVTQLVKPEPPI